MHGGNALLNDIYPSKFRKAVASGLTARGVNIIFSDYVDDFPTERMAGIITRHGTKLDADLLVSTRSFRSAVWTLTF